MFRKKSIIKAIIITFLGISSTSYSQDIDIQMYTTKDSTGMVNNAMLYLDDTPLSEIVSERELTAIKQNWNWDDVISYLNTSLPIHLKDNIETAICLERIGDYLYETDDDMTGAYHYYVASAGMLQHLGFAQREAYMNFFTGLLTWEMGKKQEADKWFRKMVAFYDQHPDVNLIDYTRYLIAVIDKLYQDKNYSGAVFYLEKFVSIGADSPASAIEQGQAHLMLGDCYRRFLRKEDALGVYQNAVPYLGLAYGEQSESYRKTVLSIAELLYESDKKHEAVRLYEKLFAQPGSFNAEEQSLICARMLDCYIAYYNFRDMLPVLEELKRLSSSGNSANPELYLQINDAIATLCHRTGRYDMAETLLLESTGMLEKNGKITEAGRAWLDLSSVYLKLHMPGRAQILADKGSAMIRSQGGMQKEDELTYLKLKGVAAMLLGEYDESSRLIREVLKLQPRSGIHRFDYASTLGLAALIAWYKQDFTEAEKIMSEAFEIASDEKYHQLNEYGTLCCNMALIYGSLEQYDKAVDYACKAAEIIRVAGGENHPDYLIQLSNCSKYLEAAGDDSMALEYALQANELLKQVIDKLLLYWSTQEMEIFINQYAYRFLDYFNSYYYRHTDKHPELTSNIYDNQLFIKGLLLNSAAKFQQAVNSISDTAISNLVAAIAANGARLEALYAQPVSSRAEPTEPIEHQNAGLQKILKTKIVEYNKQTGTNMALSLIDGFSFRDLSGELSSGEAAIEFTSFRYHSIVLETDSVVYAALLMRKGFKQPALFFLGTEKDLIPLISKHPDELYAFNNLTLYNLLWKPMEEQLQGVTKIFYSPAGLLNRIAFSAIPVNQRTTLSDQYTLYHVSSTRMVLEKSMAIEEGTGYFFGGIDYNSEPTPVPDGHPVIHTDKHQDTAMLCNVRGNVWQYLPGSLQEVNQISSVLKQSRINTNLFLGNLATETTMKQLPAKEPAIIHIASHGFTITEPTERGPGTGGLTGNLSGSINPLLRSGLLLAGANQSRKSDFSGNDGILTAFELANLDFRSVDLFVLSACETGLGEIKGSEGVYGLQRALFMSGAKSIVVSLWEVPDFETTELMTRFYEGISKGNDPESAFYEARQQMRELYPDQPSLWAGFIFSR